MPLLTLLAALLTLAGPTRAPSPEEQRLYDEGMKAYQAGDARGAEKSWKAGYGLGHDPAFLVHIGEAEEKAGAPAEAVETYRHYLREAPDASDRADIEARLARLAPAVPAPAAGGATPQGTPTPAEPTGEFGASPPGPVPPAAHPAPAGARADTEGPGRPAAAPDSGWNRYNVTAFVAAGASVLLLGTAAFFAAKASSDGNDIDRLVIYHDQAGNPDRYSAVASQYEQAMRDGPQHDRDAKIALVGAAGAAAVSVLFFVLDAYITPEPGVALAPAATGRGAQASWTWRF
jgi:hypothetical protein